MDMNHSSQDTQNNDSENQQPDSVEEKRQRDTFLTDVQIRLAQEEIQRPSGAHNTEVEEAKAKYNYISEQLKQQQHNYIQEKNSMKGREIEIQAKELELQRKRQELQEQLQRQQEKENQLNQLQNQKKDQIVKEVDQIASLVDQIAGATALLHQLKKRNGKYEKYADFIQEVYLKLNQNDQQFDVQQQLQLSEVEKQNFKLQQQQHYLEFVSNRFIRLQKEEQKSHQTEIDVNGEFDSVTLQLRARLDQNRALVAQLEQEQAKLNKECELLLIKKDNYEQNNKIQTIKLDQKVQELSNIQSAIKNLSSRTKKLTDERQKNLAKRARVQDLLGGIGSEKLEQQVDMFYNKSNKLIERFDCYNRVIGEQLLKRMRKIYRLGIFLRDLVDLEQILYKYKNGNKASIKK